MFKSNRIMYLLMVLAILVLVLGQQSVSASDVELSDNMSSYSNEDKCVDEVIDSSYEIKKENIIKKELMENVKRADEPEDISLSMDDVEVDYGDYANLNVLTDPAVDEGILSLYINQHIVNTKNLSISPASFSVNTINYEPGNYTVNVTYSGSLTYKTASTTAKLTINPSSTRVDNVRATFNDDNNIDVSLNVVGGNYNVSYGDLNVYSGENLVTSVEIEDDDVSFTIGKEYNNELLIFEYVGDEYYLSSSTNYYIGLAKFNTNMYMSYPNGFYGSTIVQPVTFYANRPINDGILGVYVDGDLIDEYSVTSGNVDVTFSLSEYNPGVYEVFLDYYGSDVYENTNYTTTLTVRQISTTLYTYNITGHRNDTVYLRAGVYNYVDDTNEGMIEFFLDDESIKTGWVYDVAVNEPYVLPENLVYGEHDLRVVYYGSNRYSNATGSAILNVVRHSTSLSIRNCTLNDEGNIEINIRTYSYNNTVDSGRMDYYVNGTLVGSVDVTGNITRIVLPDEYLGDCEYNISVVYYDSEKFDNATLNTTINPTKHNTTTRLYTYTNTNNILNLTSYVYSTNYVNINEGVVEFYINDTLIGTSSVLNNSASMVIDMDTYADNIYNLKAMYNGSRLYKKSENNTNLNYTRNKKTVYIQTTNTISEKAGKQIKINVNLTDYDKNKLPIATYINVTLFEQEYPIWTENGEINFTYTLAKNTNPGTYDITIKSGETRDYKEANRTIRLNVYKDSPYITSPNTITSTMGESIQINATLNLNREILKENITGLLKINNKTIYQGMFKNGEFQYTLMLKDKYTNENYNITIVSIETNHYYRAEKTLTLNLNPRKTYITSHNIESKNGEKIIINATIYDSLTRKPINKTSKVCIKINDVTLDNVEVKNGQLLYSYTNDYSAKDYNIKIIHGKNGIYDNSTWNGTITIKSSKLQIATHNIQTKAYNNITIKANVLADNKLATGQISTAIKINNKTIHEENITNGKISFNYTLPDTVGAGTYNLTIIAGSNRRYAGETVTVNLTVTKNYKTIEITNLTANNNKIKIKAQLVDINNKLITKNTKVNIKVAGHTIADFNVTDGNIEYDYNIPDNMKAGIYDLLIQAGQTSGYYHATTISSIKVE